jgi:hypothetical protein
MAERRRKGMEREKHKNEKQKKKQNELQNRCSTLKNSSVVDKLDTSVVAVL